MFLGKTLNSHSASPHPEKMLGGNLRWTSIPSRGSRNSPSRFILQKPEISAADTDEPSGSPNYDWGQTVTLPHLSIDGLGLLLSLRKTIEKVIYFLLLERKERSPAHEDSSIVSLKNLKGLGKYVISPTVLWTCSSN